MQIDRYFKIESSFFNMFIGEKAATKLEHDLMDCLPTADNYLDANECLARLENFGKSKLMTFCGVGMQAVYSSIKGVRLRHISVPAAEV